MVVANEAPISISNEALLTVLVSSYAALDASYRQEQPRETVKGCTQAYHAIRALVLERMVALKP